jgi:hypothetical protein
MTLCGECFSSSSVVQQCIKGDLGIALPAMKSGLRLCFRDSNALGLLCSQLIQFTDQILRTQVRVALEHLHRLVAADG